MILPEIYNQNNGNYVNPYVLPQTRNFVNPGTLLHLAWKMDASMKGKPFR